ncbi:MAG: UDP-N-acetylmuramate--L-alanine ligase [Bacteroidetes bacterium]|nr:UDP-N-acetylmuramate--L-alanine ligase [Bacteroidota bacterium]MBL6943321.1 UDP-N-acetylmuramate--L-alanine ligase [Bacteroidales bacterium]
MNYRNQIMYFLGIGGIGMSALARWFKQQGAHIYGYDLHSSPLTDELINEGMNIHFNADIGQLPENISIVVYTPAIPSDNIEIVHLKNLGIPIIKRAELIGKITKDYFTIAVAGTHGKTSISALTAHLLKYVGINVTAFVGGICKNYNSNIIISNSTEYLVVEADEYDRSLLHIEPNIAVISSMDEDHLDIYQDHEDIKTTFKKFAQKLPETGVLIHNSKLESFNNIRGTNITYGINNDASIFASNINVSSGKFVFDIDTKIGKIDNVEIQVPGIHNIENTLASVAIAIEIGLSLKEIKTGISTFKGVERRMDFRIVNENIIFIDDYAHHPEEIKATISAVKKLYPDKKITGIFQPHLFSRTRDFAKMFAVELNKLDELILMEIYPAREKPIEGITSKTILDKTNISGRVMGCDEILDYLSKNNPEVLLTMGAGDIGLLVKKIENQILIN